jgi:hypothetical protein
MIHESSPELRSNANRVLRHEIDFVIVQIRGGHARCRAFILCEGTTIRGQVQFDLGQVQFDLGQVQFDISEVLLDPG